jgi:hypothetical protein
MKKFSAGGAQGRYDRRMADIEKDYKKAMARKTGKDAEVAEAKRQQRIADAKDDLAKRTGADRTATRAAERLAESNLTKTRKYGAPQSVTKDTAGPTGKVTDTLGALTAPKSGIATPTKKAVVKKAADKPKPSAADTARNKFFQDSLKKTNFKSSARRAEAPIAPSKFDKAAFDRLKTGKGDTLKTDAVKTETTKGTGTSRLARAADPKDTSAAASRARLGALASYLNPFSYIENRARRQDPSETSKAKGGKIMKYAKGGSTPPKPTAADRAADAKFRKSIKNLKPTPEQAAAIGRANRSSGYAKGGKVKKMAVGGMSTTPSTAPKWAASNTAPPAANTAGGTVTRATPGNTQTGVPSPSAPAANTAAPTTPAANTAARATTTSAAPPATAARVTGIDPAVAAKYNASPQGIEAARVKAAEDALKAKYSSATPNRDGSNTNTYTKDAAGNVIGVQTNKNFDRNQALRDFNTVGRSFMNRGVPMKAVIQAQGELRKLQMDNKSTPAQHQAAVQSILARMNSLLPKGAAKGGSMKAANKSGRALVKKSADTEGRAMKKFAAGGLTSGHKAANGVAKKGLTKGKQVKMNKGGACYAKGGSVRSIDGIATKGKTRCKGARK